MAVDRHDLIVAGYAAEIYDLEQAADLDRAVVAAAIRVVHAWAHGLVAIDAEHDLRGTVRAHPAWLAAYETDPAQPPAPTTSSQTIPRSADGLSHQYLIVTQEIVDRFADYHRREPSWGVLHVSLDDGNYDCTISDLLPGLDEHLANQVAGTGRCDRSPVTDEERELARLHDLMTPSQRRSLASKA